MIICTKDGIVDTDYYADVDEYTYFDTRYHFNWYGDSVTHWQPLPECPTGHTLPEEQNMENEKNNLFVLDDYWRAKLQDTFMELLAASVKRPDEEEEIMNLIERVCDCILFLRTGEGL